MPEEEQEQRKMVDADELLKGKKQLQQVDESEVHDASKANVKAALENAHKAEEEEE